MTRIPATSSRRMASPSTLPDGSEFGRSKNSHNQSGDRNQNLLSRRAHRCIKAIVTAFGVAAVVFLQKPWSASPNSYEDSRASLPRKGDTKEFLHLRGQFRSFDQTRRILEITCAGLLLDADGNDLHLGATLEARRNITIYTDVQTEIDTCGQQREKLPYTPTSVIPPIPAPDGIIDNQQFSTFTVNVRMVPRRSFGFLTAELLYPWDEWIGRKVFVAANDSSSGVFPLYGFQTDDTFMNYLTATHSHSNCFDPNVERCELSVTFVMTRHYFVTACAVAVVVFNWIITSSFVFTVCSMGTSPTSETAHSLILCVAAFFAVLELRSLLPVRILFANMIDLIGVIPNVIILYWCGVVLTVRTIGQRAQCQWNAHVDNSALGRLLLPAPSSALNHVIIERTRTSLPPDETRIRPKKGGFPSYRSGEPYTSVNDTVLYQDIPGPSP